MTLREELLPAIEKWCKASIEHWWAEFTFENNSKPAAAEVNEAYVELIKLLDQYDAATKADQRTIEALIKQRDEVSANLKETTADRDRWVKRMRVLEERIAEVRVIIK